MSATPTVVPEPVRRHRRAAADDLPGSVPATLGRPGARLDDAARSRLGSRLGHDFADVRLHTDTAAAASARDVGAVAYAYGHHVVLDEAALPAAPSDRDAVLAHELVHTVQGQPRTGRQAATAAPAGITDPSAPSERDAAASGRPAAGGPAEGAPAGTVQRQPAARPDVGGLSVTLTEQGRLEVTASGPATPAGTPRGGLARRPDGRYTLVVGADSTVLSVDELPATLRGVVRTAEKGGVPARTSVDVPTCERMRRSRGGWHTYGEYRASTALRRDVTPPVSEPLYLLLLAQCRRGHTEEIVVPPAVPRPEAVPPLAPEGQAHA